MRRLRSYLLIGRVIGRKTPWENRMNRVWTGALCLVLALLAGCDGDEDGPRQIPPLAQLRIVNLVSDAPTILMDFSSNLVAGISYTEATPLSPVVSGRHLVVIAHESVIDATPTFLLQETEFPVNRNEEITLIAAGTVDMPTLTRVDQTVDTNPGADQTEVHYYNADSAGATWNVYLSSSPDSTSINGITPVSLGEGESSNLQAVSSGTHRLFITASGGSDIVYDSGAFNLSPGTRRLVVVTDNHGPGGPVRALLVDDAGARNFPAERMPSSLRVANLIAGLGNVDVSVNGSAIWTDVTATTMTNYHEVTNEGRDVEIVVTRAGQPAEVLLTESRTLVSGEFATLVLAADGAEAESRFVTDPTRPISTGAQLQFIHGAPEAGVIEVYLLDVGADPQFTSPTYVLPTLFLEVDTFLQSRDYDLVLTFAGTATELARATISMPLNTIHTVIVGDPATPGGNDFTLIVDDDSPSS